MSENLDRAAAKERCEKATPGPWTRRIDKSWRVSDPDRIIDSVDMVIVRDERIGSNIWKNERGDDENFDFIAHARADLPLALAELDAKDTTIASQHLIISNTAKALFPNSEIDSAMAEFDFDAMGACQVIRRNHQLIASQAAEIGELKLDIQTQREEIRRWMADFARQAAQIQTLRDAIEDAPHDSTPDRYGDPECGYLKHKERMGSGPCNCWKSAALAQVSASPKEAQ